MTMDRALDAALAGRRTALFDLLARGSRLPGSRMNTALADAFAIACGKRGAPADSVALALARLSPREAPGGTALEFLPVCGLCALGVRAAADETVRRTFLEELHAHAADVRFRCREGVISALVRIGQAAGDGLVRDAAGWMDGYFHAAAVLRAVCSEAFLGALHDVDTVTARFDQAFSLALRAPRAASRWPGYKELLLALEREPPRLALRFGPPVFDMLVCWSSVKHPKLREVVARIVASRRLVGRYAPEIERVRRAIAAARPPPRNPDHDVGSTRDRSRTRRQARR